MTSSPLTERFEKEIMAEIDDEAQVLTPDQKIITGMRLVLEGLGVDPNDHNFTKTPERVLKVYKEMFRPPDSELPVFDEDYTDIVVMSGIEFYTLCPHHMLPVQLIAHIAYLPKGKVLGASKLVRLIWDANRGPMTQERLTDAIIKRVEELTQSTSRGTAVALKGAHGCFSIRGVKCSTARMLTAKFTGEFESNLQMRDQFFHLVNGGQR